MRALVRLGSWKVDGWKDVARTEPIETPIRLARQVLGLARSNLEQCFEAAFFRAPVERQRVEVDVNVSADGRVQRPRVVSGVLVDALGDVCLLETLGEVVLPPEERPIASGQEMAIVRLPMTFLYQAEIWDDEAGNSDPPTNDVPGAPPTTASPGGMSSI